MPAVKGSLRLLTGAMVLALGLLLTPAGQPSPALATTGFVTAVGTHLEAKGKPFYIHGASIYHTSNRGGQANLSNTLNLAQAANLNTIRLVNFFDETGADANAPYDPADWQHVDTILAALSDRGLRAILDLSAFRNHLVNRGLVTGSFADECAEGAVRGPAYEGTNPYKASLFPAWDTFLQFVAQRVNTINGLTYSADPTIAVVSIAGEPAPPGTEDCGKPASPQELTDFYAHAFTTYKAVDSNHLLSNGGFFKLDWEEHYHGGGSGIDWQAIFALPGNDLPSIHTYPWFPVTPGQVDYQTEKVAPYMAGLNKPWFTEEFGFKQEVGDATRAADYQWVYDLQTAHGSAGAAFWNLGTEIGGGSHDANPDTPLTWQVIRQSATPPPPIFDAGAGHFSGFNLYNANSDGWCRSSYTDNALDAAFAEIGGGNAVVRSWFFQTLATADNGTRDWSRFDRTIEAARLHGVRLVITLTDQWGECGSKVAPTFGYKSAAWYESGYTSPDPALAVHHGTNWKSYRDWVSEVVSRYKNNSAIWAWQLINEAEVKASAEDTVCTPGGAQLLKNWASDVSLLIRSVDRNHPISLGTIGSGQCGTSDTEYAYVHDIPTIDLCEFHDYSTDLMPGDLPNGLQRRLDQCGALGKPLFVGEMGVARTYGGGLQERANLLADKIAAQTAAGVIGHLVWQYAQVDADPEQFDVYAGSGDPAITAVKAARDPSASGAAAIRGRVVDNAGDSLWADVRVCRAAVTWDCSYDFIEEGEEFQVTGLTAGVSYTVTIEHRPSRFTHLPVIFDLVHPGGEIRVDAVLANVPRSAVQGFVRLSDGTPVANTQVAVCEPGYSRCEVGLIAVGDGYHGAARTNDQGFYSIPDVPVLSDPSDFVTADPYNGVNLVQSETVIGPVHNHDFVINRLPGSISGHFVFADDSPVSNGAIYWTNCSNTDQYGAWNRLLATTAADGSFQVLGLPDDPNACIKIAGEAPGTEFLYPNHVAYLESSAGQSGVVLHAPQFGSGELEVVVRDFDGSTVEGAWVYLQVSPVAGSDDLYVDGDTDANGRHTFRFLPESTIRGQVEVPGNPYRFIDFDAFVGTARTSIELTVPTTATGGIRGTVSDNGAPVADAAMFACSLRCATTYTDQLGSFEFIGLNATSYEILVQVDGQNVRDLGSPVVVADAVVEHDVTLPSGSISGRVVDANGIAVGQGRVQACGATASTCRSVIVGDDGQFTITYLGPGEYSITLTPAGPSHLRTVVPGGVTVGGGDVPLSDVVINSAQPLPETTSLTGGGVISSAPGELPRLLSGQPITVTATACPGAAARLHAVSLYGTGNPVNIAMAEQPPGTYSATMTLSSSGGWTISTTFDCPGATPDESSEFNAYIDPSGYVRNTLGTPIVGAAVTLYRADSPKGPFEQATDPTVMSPGNRNNPDITDSTGHFGWDVFAGYYRVRAHKVGCVSAANHAIPYAETATMPVPPPVFDIDLRLYCGESAQDTTPPEIVIATPVDGATYVLGSRVIASFACTDEAGGSGLETCVGTTAQGAPIDTSTVGSKVFVVSATDRVGNHSTASVGYRVVYAFALDSDLLAAPSLNDANAGSAIPIGFSLGGITALSAVTSDSPASVQINCSTFSAMGNVDLATGQGKKDLTVNKAGKFKYVWKTDKAWAGTCRTLTVKLDDGTAHEIYFDFRKPKK